MPVNVLNARGGIKAAFQIEEAVVREFLTGTEWRWKEQSGPQIKNSVTGLWHSLQPQILDGALILGINEVGEAE